MNETQEVESEIYLHLPNKESSFREIFSFVCTTVGLTISIAAFGLLVLTLVLFAEWRQNYKNQLLTQFMLARTAYTIVGYVKFIFQLCDLTCAIYLDTIAKSYTEMALVLWMFVFTKQMYDSLVKVFTDSPPSVLKLSLIAWLLPAFVSLTLYFLLYLNPDMSIHFHMSYYILMKWPMLTANGVMLISILRSLLNNNQSVEHNLRITIVMIVLIIMFCIQQLVIDLYKFIYIILLKNYVSQLMNLSNIFTTYHCAISTFFWVFGNSKTREMWKRSKSRSRPNSQLSFRTSSI